MKCNLCDQRKGRRYCPAKNTTICAQCCGEKRVLEIDCPEICEYLKIGRSYERNQVGARRYRPNNPIEQEKMSRVLSNFEPVIVDMQTLIAVERKSSRDLVDAEVAEALDCLLATLRTEDRGVIYETTSGNLRVESLRRQLSSLIQSYRYPKESDRQRIHLKDASECLEVLRSVIARHMEAGSSSLSFVDFLVRHLPRKAEIAPSAPSIIVPGR
jgi:hypothetical protein